MLITRKETITRSTGRYFRFVEAALSTVKAFLLPLYSCKYSKKVYTHPNCLLSFFSKIISKKIIVKSLILLLKWIASLAYQDSVPFRISRPCKKILTRMKSRYIGFYFCKDPEIVLFQRGYNPPYCDRFFGIYEILCKSLLLRKNRKNPETFHKNIYRG
jgi:uncharacterized protein YjhX (UPF0386 family)